MRGAAALLLFAALHTPWAWAQEPGPESALELGEWNFTASLDGKPIGTHRFVVSGTGAERRVASRAQFVVRMLGIAVYSYNHEAQERWQAGCLRELRSDTDDDGHREQVDRRFDGDCLMSFGYWNPRILQQKRLVDPQTGRVSTARFEAVADAAIEVRGQSLAAHGWRLVTDKQRITLWYAATGGRWIALDAEVKGGRVLRYRLNANVPSANDKALP